MGRALSRITLDAQVKKIDELIERANALPDKDRRFQLKFILACLIEQNRIGGLHTVNVNNHQKQSIVVQYIPVDERGRETITVQPASLPPADPQQLPISFPSAEPVVYTAAEVMDDDNELSDELPPDLPDPKGTPPESPAQ